MFIHEIERDTFEKHILSNKNKTTYLEIVPERGGIITRFVVADKTIFYLDNGTLIDPTKNIRGGNPILFPICSYIKDNTYSYEGNDYNMKQHGFARNLPWKVLEVKASEKNAIIRLELESNELTLAQYPFDFKLIFEYILDDRSLTINSTFVNRENKPLPFYAGYHPYFYFERKDEVEIIIPSTCFTEPLEGSLKDGKYNYSQDEINVIYTDLELNTCSLIDNVRNLKINVIFDDIYKYIVIWSLKGKDFICLEPWMATTDALNNKSNLILLDPLKELTSRVVYEVEV